MGLHSHLGHADHVRRRCAPSHSLERPLLASNGAVLASKTSAATSSSPRRTDTRDEMRQETVRRNLRNLPRPSPRRTLPGRWAPPRHSRSACQGGRRREKVREGHMRCARHISGQSRANLPLGTCAAFGTSPANLRGASSSSQVASAHSARVSANSTHDLGRAAHTIPPNRTHDLGEWHM